MGNGESSSNKQLVSVDTDGKQTMWAADEEPRQRTDDAAVELSKRLINDSRKHGVGEKNISRESFVDYFHSEKAPEAGSLLYVRFSGCTCGTEPPPSIPRETFVKFCAEIRNLIANSHQQKYYALLFSKGRPNIEREAVEDLFHTCFRLEAEMVGSKYDCDPNSCLVTSVTESLARACMQGEKLIAVDSLQMWMEKTCPNMIHSSIHRWVAHRLHSTKLVQFGNTNSTKSNRSMRSDLVNDGHLHPIFTWLFANTLPKLYTKPREVQLPSPVRPMRNVFYDPHEVLNTLMKFNSSLEWTRLYSSLEQGQSMNRFQHHVFSYRGPTAMLVRTDAEVTICVCIDHEWRERNTRWGGEQCIAVQITPCFKIFEVGDRMMYFNLTTRGYPFGLHVGRNPKSLVLEIDPDLCLASVKKIPYKLESLEVWGCAGEDIRDAQIKQKKWENAQVEKQKKVKRGTCFLTTSRWFQSVNGSRTLIILTSQVNLNAVDWNENPDRYLLELAGKPTYSSTFKR